MSISETSREGLIFGALFLVFWVRVLGFDFVWDDYSTVLGNASLSSWKTLVDAWGSDFWALHNDSAQSGYWRPLVTVFYVLITKCIGTQAWVYHFFNLVFHGLTVWMAARILFIWGFNKNYAFLALTWYAFHPTHGETVSFISALPDILAGLFSFSALYCAMSDRRSNGQTLRVLLFYGLALLCKEPALAMGPVILIWYSWRHKVPMVQLGKSKLFFGLVSVSLLYLYAHVKVTPELMGDGALAGSTATSVSSLYLFFYHLGHALLPLKMSPTPSWLASAGWFDIEVWVGMFLLLGLVIYRYLSTSPQKAMFFALSWFLLWLPYSNLIPLAGVFADRYMYTKVFFLIAGLVWIAKEIKLNLILSWVFLAFQIGIFFQAQSAWKSSRSLWAHATKVSPSSKVAWNEWGNVHLSQGEWMHASQAYETALSLDKDYPEAQLNLSVSHLQSGQKDEAESTIHAYLEKHPQDSKALDLASTIALKQGKITNAISYGEQAVAHAPGVWKYSFNLALLYEQVGKLREAEKRLEGIVNRVQYDIRPLQALARIQMNQAKWKEAKASYEILVRVSPHDPVAKDSLKKVKKIMKMLGK